MKITALVENTTNQGWRTVHGLSLYIETPGHKILFDVGPDDTLFANAERAGVDLAAVDTAIISHGHSDHGGALAAFLEVNRRAKVYIQRSAFDMHYIKILEGDTVKIEMSPYDITKGRITYRNKN